MSDTIGVIGQKYEDRKSKKAGFLLDRDEANKKLNFLDDNAEPFQVSYAAFKSNWRKVITEAPVEVEPTETAEPEVETTTQPVECNEDDKIKDFVKAITDVRVASVEVTPTSCSVMADDVIICTIDKVENFWYN